MNRENINKQSAPSPQGQLLVYAAERAALKNLVEQYLVFAEGQAMRRFYPCTWAIGSASCVAS